ncbi:Uncharacterized protein dnl_40060 [Desulfonema limicola]|uniref:Uncharacterized protein n=1 Tax=Desulfonema limicola TaxID=45656 RepID=A0A975BA87_9BACT|nr:Uncharacterized protein dnl_40060 [Desulfonema limicola]
MGTFIADRITRLYYPETFKTYNLYILKFQTFTRSKSLELLNNEDKED